MTRATFDAKRVLELAEQGLSCRGIAKELGCAPSTVSRWADRAGASFDRAQSAAAVKAHTLDLAAGRVRLAEKMLAASEAMLDKMDEPYLVYNSAARTTRSNRLSSRRHRSRSVGMSSRRRVLRSTS